MFRTTDQGFHIEFPNGWTVSVQWGPFNYCSNRSMASGSQVPAEGWSSQTAEVAAWRTDAIDTEAWYDGNPNGVRGHMDAGEVMEYIRMVSGLEDAPQPKAKRMMTV